MSGDSTTLAVSAGRGTREEPAGTDVQVVFDALGDPDCRAILRAIGPSALTASECSESCDLPLSTTYRKLERLSESGLVEEQLRLRRDGKHANQYRRRFGGVHVDVHDDGTMDLDLWPREETAASGVDEIDRVPADD